MTKSTAIRVGVHEAKTRFSELLRAVAAGQSVEILRNGEPVARLVPMTLPTKRTFGADQGLFTVPDDFDEPLPADLLEAFDG
jgi:prevent-host-death family protein